MAANQLASGAVVLTTSADQLVNGLNKAQKDVHDWADKTQKHIETKDITLKPKIKPQGGSDVAAEMMKSLGMRGVGGPTIASSLAGTMLDLGLKIAQTFSTHYVDQFNLAMERGAAITKQLGAAIEKVNEKRLKVFDESGSASIEQLEEWKLTADKSLLGMQATVRKYRDQQDEMAESMGRSLVKGTMGWMGPIGDRFKAEEDELKSQLEHAQTTLSGHQKYLEDLAQRIKKLQAEQALPGIMNPVFLDALAKKSLEAAKSITGSTDSIIKGLTRVYDTMGMSDVDKAIYDAKEKGITNPNDLAEIRLRAEAGEIKKRHLDEADAAKKRNEAIEEGLKTKLQEIETYGLDEQAVKRLEMVKDGATESQLKRFDLMAAASEKMHAAMEESARTHSPKIAGAIASGSADAFKMHLKLQGFDMGDGLQRDMKLSKELIAIENRKILEGLEQKLGTKLSKVLERNEGPRDAVFKMPDLKLDERAAEQTQVHKDNGKKLDKIAAGQKELNDRLTKQGVRLFGAKVI
jgi:hypothetical protein